MRKSLRIAGLLVILLMTAAYADLSAERAGFAEAFRAATTPEDRRRLAADFVRTKSPLGDAGLQKSFASFTGPHWDAVLGTKGVDQVLRLLAPSDGAEGMSRINGAIWELQSGQRASEAGFVLKTYSEQRPLPQQMYGFDKANFDLIVIDRVSGAEVSIECKDWKRETFIRSDVELEQQLQRQKAASPGSQRILLVKDARELPLETRQRLQKQGVIVIAEGGSLADTVKHLTLQRKIIGDAASLTQRSQERLRIFRAAASEAGTAAKVAAAFSVATRGYAVAKGEISLTDAAVKVAEDVAIAGGSTYVAEGILQEIGGKYVLIVPIREGLRAGVATLIFDNVGSVYAFAKGEIDTDELLVSMGKSVAGSLASGTATYVTVVLGATPGGVCVYAVGVGTYICVSEGFAALEAYSARQHIRFEDLLGRLPAEISRRVTAFGDAGAKRDDLTDVLLGRQVHAIREDPTMPKPRDTPFEPKRPSPLD